MNETLELKVITAIYKQVVVEVKGDDGKIELEEDEQHVKDLIVLQLFDRGDLRLSQYVNKKFMVSKKKCMVFDRLTQKYYRLAHTYAEVKGMLEGPEKTPMGFKKTT